MEKSDIIFYLEGKIKKYSTDIAMIEQRRQECYDTLHDIDKMK